MNLSSVPIVPANIGNTNNNVNSSSTSNAVPQMTISSSPATVKKASVPGGVVRTATNGFYGQVLIGNNAKYLGKKSLPEQTHEWTCYVRGVRNVDISPWVVRVDFHLHPSFAVPVRTLTSPPFEVTERGWGEFEIAVHVHFADPREEAVQFIHQLRLYEDITAPPNPKRVICVERVEDILFSAQISAEFRQTLEMCSRSSLTVPKKRRVDISIDDNMLTAPEKAELATLTSSSKKVLEQIKALRDAYIECDSETETLRKAIANAEKRLVIKQQSNSNSNSSVNNSNSNGGSSAGGQGVSNGSLMAIDVKPTVEHQPQLPTTAMVE